MDFQWLNVTIKKNPYLLPFIKKVLDKVVGHKVYSFLDGFFNYHQIMIAPPKIGTNMHSSPIREHSFGYSCHFGSRMLHQLINKWWVWLSKIILECSWNFMYDFNVFSNLNTHLTKLWLCFDKCSAFVISLKLEKCMFHVHWRVILGYAYPRLTIGFKKNSTIVHMFTLKTLKDIQVFNGMAQYYRCFIKDFAFNMSPITKLLQKAKAFNGQQSANKLGKKSNIAAWMHQFDFTPLKPRVSCLHIHL